MHQNAIKYATESLDLCSYLFYLLQACKKRQGNKKYHNKTSKTTFQCTVLQILTLFLHENLSSFKKYLLRYANQYPLLTPELYLL